MLNRPDANVYNRRQRSRFTVTTIDAMTIVAASRAGKFPVSVARLMTAPSPMVVMVCPWKWKYSATILASSNGLSMEMEVLGNDTGVPRATGGGHKAGDQVRKH